VFDVVVVGGGTAGCVLAARLSEAEQRTVCLLEAGPDYGALVDRRWPPEMLDASALPFTHDWGTGGEDARSLGARVLGGSSAHNACMVVQGTPADYDEWGPEWAYSVLAPHLDRARMELCTAPANTDRPAPFHQAFMLAAQEAGYPLLDRLDDPDRPVGVAPFPANVVNGMRWNAAFAYLDPARPRANLTVEGGMLVDRVMIERGKAIGVILAGGRRIEAQLVVLAAGAYLTPTILVRSGIGPEPDLRRLGISAVAVLPVGERLLDHHGTGMGWQPSERLRADTAAHHRDGPLFQAHAILKAASSSCAAGSWDIHLVAWTNPAETPGGYEVSAGVFHLKPRSFGRLHVPSTDPAALPHVTRGFLADEDDLMVLVEALELARTLAATNELRNLVTTSSSSRETDLAAYVRSTARNYFHPAGTCAIGAVVDPAGRVLGVDGLIVSDASIMPTIPRANTNLTTAAIAERIAQMLSEPSAEQSAIQA
jgi:choline dehydrogenase